jgi:hypothetical protein
VVFEGANKSSKTFKNIYKTDTMIKVGISGKLIQNYDQDSVYIRDEEKGTKK